jgi:hypothetical protein
MWMFTKYGFFSTTCAKAGSLFDTLQDDDVMMIRARWHGHLKNLQERFPELADFEIVATPKNDYRYRILVPKKIWVKIATALTEEIDYNNFKSEVETFHDENNKPDEDYHHALMDVWSTMYSYRNSGKAPI